MKTNPHETLPPSGGNGNGVQAVDHALSIHRVAIHRVAIHRVADHRAVARWM